MPSWFRENVSSTLQAKEVSAVLSSNFIYGAMLTHRKHPAPLYIPPAPRTGLWFASTASVPPSRAGMLGCARPSVVAYPGGGGWSPEPGDVPPPVGSLTEVLAVDGGLGSKSGAHCRARPACGASSSDRLLWPTLTRPYSHGQGFAGRKGLEPRQAEGQSLPSHDSAAEAEAQAPGIEPELQGVAGEAPVLVTLVERDRPGTREGGRGAIAGLLLLTQQEGGREEALEGTEAHSPGCGEPGQPPGLRSRNPAEDWIRGWAGSGREGVRAPQPVSPSGSAVATAGALGPRHTSSLELRGDCHWAQNVPFVLLNAQWLQALEVGGRPGPVPCRSLVPLAS